MHLTTLEVEKAITKSSSILDGKENELSLTEILQCKRLKKKHEDDEENQTTVIVESDFAEAIMQKRQKKEDELKYLNCRFLFPASNILERFFSVAGHALNDLRQNITPQHLEQQLFLRANQKYWTVKTVNSVLSDWYRFVIVFFSIDLCFHFLLFHVTQLLQLLVSIIDWQVFSSINNWNIFCPQ